MMQVDARVGQVAAGGRLHVVRLHGAGRLAERSDAGTASLHVSDAEGRNHAATAAAAVQQTPDQRL